MTPDWCDTIKRCMNRRSWPSNPQRGHLRVRPVLCVRQHDPRANVDAQDVLSRRARPNQVSVSECSIALCERALLKELAPNHRIQMGGRLKRWVVR